MDLQAGPVDDDEKERTMTTAELTNKEADTLTALRDLDAEGEGATAAEWQQAAADLGVSHGSYYNARKRLLDMGLVTATEVRYTPVEIVEPLITAEDVIPQITRAGSRSNQAYTLYLEAPSAGRLQHLVMVVIDEAPTDKGLVQGHTPWTRKITAEVYEAAEAAIIEATGRLTETEEGGDPA